MLEHDRFNASGDINVFDSFCEWIICHYLYFPRMNFIFQPKVSDGCHNMTQKSMGFNGNTIVTVKRHSYRINFWFMAENEVVTRMKNADLSEKNWRLLLWKNIYFFWRYQVIQQRLWLNNKVSWMKQRRKRYKKDPKRYLQKKQNEEKWYQNMPEEVKKYQKIDIKMCLKKKLKKIKQKMTLTLC